MLLITRTAVAVGLSGALLLGSAGACLAAPTPAPATTVGDNDGLVAGLLNGLLGDNVGNDHNDSHVKIRCGADGTKHDGARLLDVGGLNLAAVLEGVHVLGLNLGNCDGDDRGLLGGLLGGH